MTFEDKWRLVFRKHPEVRYNRAKAYYAFGEEFYNFNVFATKAQIIDFFTDFSAIERKIRNVLLEDEFKLTDEQNANRYQKSAEFREENKISFKEGLKPSDRKDYEEVFGAEDYKEDSKENSYDKKE